jgi:aspartyl-tRNA synthetase
MVYRTAECGRLRVSDCEKTVILSGWVHRRRDHGGLIFIDLRDASGIVQVVFSPEIDPDSHIKAGRLRAEWVVRIEGKVVKRPKGAENPHIATGEIEVIAESFDVLNTSLTPPFEVADEVPADEELRLRYRYLDLRRESTRSKILLRHKVVQKIRDFLVKKGFIEIETPALIRSTPEGARDFLVPSRLIKGAFYALPQSPQLFKQILMVAGFEKYFQIARCFRDEDLRADRQPEFTQLDIEASFVTEDDIYRVVEELMKDLFSELLSVDVETPFPKIEYSQAMLRYGTDKPDIRFGMEIEDLSWLKRTDIQIFQKAEVVRGMGVSGVSWSRKEADTLTELAKSLGAGGLAWFLADNSSFTSPLAKFLKEEEIERLRSSFSTKPKDVILIVADKKSVVEQVLSELRPILAKRLSLIKESFSFCWITGPPLVEFDEKENSYRPSHHPFTAPRDADWAILQTSPEKAKARAYDLVLNGVEIGGGSIRIHKRDQQEMLFSALKIERPEEFSFLLDALSFGAPPHGGIAIGLDRLIMIMAKANSIRDVICFPKTQSGFCPLTSAPFSVEPSQLKELGIKIM